LFSDYESFGKFIDKFEDATQKEIHALRRIDKENTTIGQWEMNDFRIAISILRYAGDEYEMQPYHCWRKGTIKLAREFENNQIAQALPLVFEEYELRMSMGIAPHLSRQEIEDIAVSKKNADRYNRWYNMGKQALDAEQ
jgi:hypothetical protein